jgi:hypothetical protein
MEEKIVDEFITYFNKSLGNSKSMFKDSFEIVEKKDKNYCISLIKNNEDSIIVTAGSLTDMRNIKLLFFNQIISSGVWYINETRKNFKKK